MLNKGWKTFAVVALILAICIPLRASFPGRANAGDMLVTAKSISLESAASPASKPAAPEIDRLKFYLGTWDYTESYPKSAFYPEGGKNTGVYTSKLGPGGNSLENSFHSQGPVGDFEGLLIMTWDPKEKSYKSYAFGNDFPGCLVQTGNFEGDTLVYRGEFSMGEQHIALRNSTRLSAPNRISADEFMAVNGQPEKLLVHIEAVKRAEK
jgi:hypothetical protein